MKKTKIKTFVIIIENFIYYLILIPLIIITLMIVYQQITEPDKIPDVFGWKMFIILDEYMNDSVKYGDLVLTKNIEPEVLTNGEVIAFRNDTNTVTIHKILEINAEKGIDTKTKEERIIRTFTMNALTNETNDTKFVKDSKVEGILRHIIPYLRTYNTNNTEPICSCSYNWNNNYNRYDLFICSTGARQKR